MKALVFDVETTGLPEWKLPSSDPSQPFVTQLCADLFDDETGERYSYLDALIYPQGWEVPPEIEKLTGISTRRCLQGGASMYNVMSVFIDMWLRCEVRVAHNESFDARMIRIELKRHSMFSELVFNDTPLADNDTPFADHWKGGNAYCTLKHARAIMGGKMPKLGEAYQHFFDEPMGEAHNAPADVAATRKLYMELKKREAH